MGVCISSALARRRCKVKHDVRFAGEFVQAVGMAQITAKCLNTQRLRAPGSFGVADQRRNRVAADKLPGNALANIAKADDEYSGG